VQQQGACGRPLIITKKKPKKFQGGLVFSQNIGYTFIVVIIFPSAAIVAEWKAGW
jgi:hypothetical protein